MGQPPSSAPEPSKLRPAHTTLTTSPSVNATTCPSLSILDKTARIDLPGSSFHGLDRYEAREQIVLQLKALDLLVEVKEHPMTVPVSQRSSAVIEPRLSDQWFLAVNKQPKSGGDSIAAKATAAVREGHIKFTPQMYEKTYQQWMENIHDWCLSRQLWWGHRIPAWFCDKNHITVARETPTSCPTCASTNLRQETDVLDTWFSSGMLPFTVFGWPETKPDMAAFSTPPTSSSPASTSSSSGSPV